MKLSLITALFTGICSLALVAQEKPNIVYMHIDNIGLGELSCYDGGLTRGAKTPNIDKLAAEGMQLWNFAPESQCTPSRSALMTGRYSIRSGTHTVALAGDGGGLVKWEKTIAEVLSENGYATAIMGKWHIGASKGRWPTDQGFDEWYGPAHTYDEALWVNDPWYDEKRDGIAYMYEGVKGEDVKKAEQLTVELKVDLDLEFLDRSMAFIEKSTKSQKPFYLYFNHTLTHFPNIPRDEFKGRSGRGDWADCLMQLDHDVAALLKMIDDLGQRENTIFIFAGDNGPEHFTPWRGDGGRFNGSYFSGSEANLRTPCIIRYPGVVPEGVENNEIVHITDMFTSIIKWTGAQIPNDRVIDGIDQTAFFEGKQEKSNREGFPYWMGETMYGVKWQNFKTVFVKQKNLAAPMEILATPHMINLDVDPKEQEPYNYPHLHSWVMAHVAKIITNFKQSEQIEPFIPAGAPIDYVPNKK